MSYNRTKQKYRAYGARLWTIERICCLRQRRGFTAWGLIWKQRGSGCGSWWSRASLINPRRCGRQIATSRSWNSNGKIWSSSIWNCGTKSCAGNREPDDLHLFPIRFPYASKNGARKSVYFQRLCAYIRNEAVYHAISRSDYIEPQEKIAAIRKNFLWLKCRSDGVLNSVFS